MAYKPTLVESYDFDWVMKMLEISDKKLINKFLELNDKQMKHYYEDGSYPKFKLLANKRFRGRAVGHFIMLDNKVEIKETMSNKPLNYDQRILLAHEFAHALIYNKDIVGNRAGHGVNYYLMLMELVVWNSDCFSEYEKLAAASGEFSYSCSLGIYKGVEKIVRSQSTTISLPLSYFTIQAFLNDGRADIVRLGKWFIKILSKHVKNDKFYDVPIDELIKDIISSAHEEFPIFGLTGAKKYK